METLKTAVIEITKPLSFMDLDYYIQEVPLHALNHPLVDVKKGTSGHKMISIKNIKVLKIFDTDDKKGINDYIKKMKNMKNRNLTETINSGLKNLISESLKYHIDNDILINESVYRPGSEAHINLLKETRDLFDKGLINLSPEDGYIFETTDIGKFGSFKGNIVPLDVLLIEYDGGKYDEDDTDEIDIDEIQTILNDNGWGDLPYERFIDFELSDYYTGTKNSTKYAIQMNRYLKDISKGIIDENKQPELNKIKRNSGSGKKYVVYVKNPKTDKVKKITFGDKKGGLKSKTGNSKARKSFSARHNWADKKDKMTAGYWSCRLNKSGLVKGSTAGYW